MKTVEANFVLNQKIVIFFGVWGFLFSLLHYVQTKAINSSSNPSLALSVRCMSLNKMGRLTAWSPLALTSERINCVTSDTALPFNRRMTITPILSLTVVWKKVV